MASEKRSAFRSWVKVYVLHMTVLFFVIAFVHQQASLKAPTIPNPVFAWDDVLGTT